MLNDNLILTWPVNSEAYVEHRFSETMSSFRDSHEDVCNTVLFQSPTYFMLLKKAFGHGLCVYIS